MVRAWQIADFNSKDLQKPQGSNVTANRILDEVRGNSSSASNTNCKCCGGQHPASECKYRQTSVMCVRRKVTWLESAKISNKVLCPLARNFRLEDKAEVI